MLKKLIDLNAYPVAKYLKNLLVDKTTKKNIVFATESYSDKGSDYKPECQMTEALLKNIEIQPRIAKAQAEQNQRTRKKAEVFTPAWLCCKMNNHCDSEWFNKENVFNIMDGEKWISTKGPVTFSQKKTWKNYVDSRRLEITCGEAPYVVSRYDASTGEMIDLNDRIGILDRKLRVVNENTGTREEWFKWTLRAFQSVYGYEWQGDSLLIARINLLMSFIDYYQARWGEDNKDEEFEKTLKQIVNVITWNFWQMDGLKGTIPFGSEKNISKKPVQSNIFMMGWNLGVDNEDEMRKIFESTSVIEQKCRIFDWRSKQSVQYSSLQKGE